VLETGEECDLSSLVGAANSGCTSDCLVVAGYTCATPTVECVGGSSIPGVPLLVGRTASSLSVDWAGSDGHGLEVDYLVQYRELSSQEWETVADNNGTDDTSARLLGDLLPLTGFVVRVQSATQAGASDWSPTSAELWTLAVTSRVNMGTYEELNSLVDTLVDTVSTADFGVPISGVSIEPPPPEPEEAEDVEELSADEIAAILAEDSDAFDNSDLVINTTATATDTKADVIVLGNGIARFTQGSFSATRGDSEVVFGIERISGTFATVSVNYSATSGTAQEGVNFQPLSGVVTFVPGESLKLVTLPLITTANDGPAWSPALSLTLELSDPQNGLVLDATGQAVVEVLLTDEDPKPTVAFLQDVWAVPEQNGMVTITVVRGENPAGGVGVHVSTGEGHNAVIGSHFTPLEEELVFADAETSLTFDVEIFFVPTLRQNRTILLNMVAIEDDEGVTQGTVVTPTARIVVVSCAEAGDCRDPNAEMDESTAVAVASQLLLHGATVAAVDEDAVKASVKDTIAGGLPVGSLREAFDVTIIELEDVPSGVDVSFTVTVESTGSEGESEAMAIVEAMAHVTFLGDVAASLAAKGIIEDGKQLLGLSRLGTCVCSHRLRTSTM
jgi:hypothetical protein